jgi:hypothetical protein
VVRVLVLSELHNLDQVDAFLRRVPIDEAVTFELAEERFHLNRIERKQLALDALWPVLKTAFAICKGP